MRGAGVIFLFLMPLLAAAQLHPLEPDTLPNKKRLGISLGIVGGVYVAGYTYLSSVWYAGQERSRFHWFNDNGQWLQLDKVGHAYGAYQESRGMIELLRWAGVSKGKRVLWGGLAGFLMQSPIEVLDGFSAKWGASWGDLLGNAAGSGLAALNEGLWEEQRIQLKWSFWPSGLAADHPAELGTGVEQVLKDYNGHTYWLSVAPDPFLPRGSKFERLWPDWLSLSFGYGGHGMVGGYGEDPKSAIRAREYREYYLSLDVDWLRIKTRKRGLKLLFGVLNAVKFPLPALRFSREGTGFLPLGF